MRDFFKWLLAALLGAGIALAIALPLLFIGEEPYEPTIGKNGQVFPDKDFLLFEDMWKGKLSSKSFNPTFSAVNPNQYFCTENLSDGKFMIYRKNIDDYDGESDDCSVGEKVTKSTAFSEWYRSNGMQNYYLSPDEKYALARNNYMKQWRHSYFSDYYVFDLVNEEEVINANIATFKQVQYATWSPNVDGYLKLLWVDNNKDIYFASVVDWFSTARRVTDDGGWCMDNGEHHLLGIGYESDPTKCIYNGVPEWNYEDEMVSTTNTIYWAPDGKSFTFAAFDVSEIELLKYSVYPEKATASSPKEIVKDSIDQFPRVNTIHYAKAAGKIAKTRFYIVDVSKSTFDENTDKKELVPIGEILDFERGTGGNPENRYFTRLSYATDSSRFAMVWSSRAGTQSKTVICNTDVANTDCSIRGSETGGVFGEFDDEGHVWTNLDEKNGQKNMYHGWVGDFGPFEPILTGDEYFTIYSKKVAGSEQTESHAYGMKIKDGYWNIARESFRNLPNGITEFTWITDTTEDQWVVTQLNFYDSVNQILYFTGARGNKVRHRQRHVFRVSTAGVNFPVKEPECVTCELEQDENGASHCGWVDFRRNCQETIGGTCKMRFIANCRGNLRPKTFITPADQDFSITGKISFNLIQDNTKLQKTLDEMKGYPTIIYGTWENPKWGGLKHNFEMFVPKSFSIEGNERKYPVFLEVYGGPGYQKVQQTFKTGWTQVHLPGAYDAITVSVDGRGSAFQGDKFTFSNYRALAHTERVDQSDFMNWLLNDSEWADRFDKTRVSLYGWSYGGYTTTHIIGYGGGEHGKIFTSGVAVAPLADRRFYDAMHAERYMDFTGEPNELLSPHWKNCSMIERPILENDMAHFRDTEYHLIHGTNDDNVHFLSAARMTKELTKRGIEFDNFFYADEDHSIRSTTLTQQHIYRNIIKRIVHSWGYVWNGDGEGYNRQ